MGEGVECARERGGGRLGLRRLPLELSPGLRLSRRACNARCRCRKCFRCSMLASARGDRGGDPYSGDPAVPSEPPSFLCGLDVALRLALLLARSSPKASARDLRTGGAERAPSDILPSAT